MPPLFRVLAVVLVLAGGATGCSTPRRRAAERASAFHQLSPADRALVLHGRVRPGLSQAGVYIAWGEPDEKTVARRGKDGESTETWIYHQRVTITEPLNSYEFFGPNQAYHHLLPASPPRTEGESGNEALQWFQPHVRSLDTWRIMEFQVGSAEKFKVVSDAVSPAPETIGKLHRARSKTKVPKKSVQRDLFPAPIHHQASGAILTQGMPQRHEPEASTTLRVRRRFARTVDFAPDSTARPWHRHQGQSAGHRRT